MEKFLKNNKRRIASLVMAFALVFVSFIAYAPNTNAYIYSHDSGVYSALSGTFTFNWLYDRFNQPDAFYPVSVPFGGRVPHLAEQAYTYQPEHLGFNSTYDDDRRIGVEFNLGLSRFKRTVDYLGTSYKFDRYRYEYNLRYDDGEGSVTGGAYYKYIRFDLDPFYFKYDYAAYTQLLTFRVDRYTVLTLNGKYSYYDSGANSMVTKNIRYSYGVAGDQNLAYMYPFTQALTVSEGTIILLHDVSITLTPQANVDGSTTFVSFELLCDPNGQNILYNDDGAYDFAEYVNSRIKRGADPGSATWFTSWVGDVASGFFDVEIMPGFSFGGVFGIILAVVCITLILKFFGGG